ncbi:MAG TPA: hypothetical protein VFE63_22135 [Roseiarcus sp.]|jgi:hypothetical protein|nr:hypothetical protein [Roseiarcus sp.]
MSEQLQFRRGTAAQVAAFTGAQGEIVVDTTNNRLAVNDGSTAGGWLIDHTARHAVADAAYTATVNDRLIAYTSISTAMTVTLPSAATFPTGARLLIVDESGSCSSTLTITAARAGSDTIDGGASAVISTAYGYVALESNGVSAWTVVDQVGLGAQSTHGANITFGVLEGAASGLSGASVTTSLSIPANCIVLAVSERVTTTITGATSFSVGFSGNATQFGSVLSTATGSTNYGLIGPTAFYSATPIVLTAAGGNFSGGAVRLAIHTVQISPPSS